jgi:hypothetical protein
MELFFRWFFGLGVFALGLGWLLIYFFLEIVHIHIKAKAGERGEEKAYDEVMKPLDVPSWLVGLVERTFFAVLVAFNVSATALAILTWIALKMAFSWNIVWREKGSITLRSLAFSALLANLFSMLFALIGGLICRGGV